MVRNVWSPIGANEMLASGQQSSTNGVPLTGNSERTATSGRARTLSQSNPGWLGSTVTVAGSVCAHSRLNAVCPRRAPAVAVSTVAVASATSRASTSSDRHRRRTSNRSQVRTICTGPSRWPAPSRPQECYSDQSR